MSALSCIDIEPKSPATATVILLHGLGADGNDFVPVVPELQLPPSMAVRFIFPNAPSIPVTINGGYVMPAWYDITEINIDRKIDATQLIASAEQVRLLIERRRQKLVARNEQDHELRCGRELRGVVLGRKLLDVGADLAGVAMQGFLAGGVVGRFERIEVGIHRGFGIDDNAFPTR